MLSRFVRDRTCWQYWFIHLFPIVVIFIAFILGAVSTDSCHFLLYEGPGNDSAIGLFRLSLSRSATDFCTTWSYTNARSKAAIPDWGGLPAALVAAQAFAVMACVLGIASTILLFISFYLPRFLSRNIFRITIPTLTIAAGVFQIFTFLVFAVDNCTAGTTDAPAQCSLLTGARQSLSAAIMYLGMGIGLIFYPKLERPLLQGRVGDEGNSGDAGAPAPSMDEIEGLLEEGSVTADPVVVIQMDGKNVSTSEPVVDQSAVSVEDFGKTKKAAKNDNASRKKPDPVADEDEVNVKTTMLPNGSRKVEKTTLNPDGSKTTTVITQPYGTY